MTRFSSMKLRRSSQASSSRPGTGVCNGTTLLICHRIRHMASPAQSTEAAVAAAEQCLEKGEPLMAYNALQEALDTSPEHVRLRQLQALALARSGDTGRANEI